MSTITVNGTPPLAHIADFDAQQVRFGELEMRDNGSKKMQVFYMTKEGVLVQPMLITPKLKIPFDVKNWNKENEAPSYNLTLECPETESTYGYTSGSSERMYEWLHALDRKVLEQVHSLLYPDKHIDGVSMLHNPILKRDKNNKYNPNFKVKLDVGKSAHLVMENIAKGVTFTSPEDLRRGHAFVKFKVSHVWVMGNNTFGCMLQALRVKYIPYVDSVAAAVKEEWVVAEEKKGIMRVVDHGDSSTMERVVKQKQEGDMSTVKLANMEKMADGIFKYPSQFSD